MENLFERQKWFNAGEEVSVGDLVMFKKESSEFGKHFSLGKVDEICESHDDLIRNVWIRYKNLSENNSRRVQRDIKTIYKILSIEDTSLHESLEQAWKIADEVRTSLDDTKADVTKTEAETKAITPSKEDSVPKEATKEDSVPEEETKEDSVPEEETKEDSVPKEETKEDSVPAQATKEDSVPKDDYVPENEPRDDTVPRKVPNNDKVPKKKRKTELERLNEWSVKLSQVLQVSGANYFFCQIDPDQELETSQMNWSHLYFDKKDEKKLGVQSTGSEIVFM